MTDVSSQEMGKPVDIVRYRSLNETSPIIQSLIGRTDLKDQSGQQHKTDKRQQKTYKRTVDFDSPEIVDTPDRQIFDADSEELYGGRVPRRTVRMISDQSSIETTLLSNNRTNRTVYVKKLNSSVIKANLSLEGGSQDTADNSTEITSQNQGCSEISVESPTNEKNSLDQDTVSY